jgi:hypothetical protein
MTDLELEIRNMIDTIGEHSEDDDYNYTLDLLVEYDRQDLIPILDDTHNRLIDSLFDILEVLVNEQEDN